MFYAHFVLAKKGPLARIWLAAHWDKKLTKAHVFETNIESSVEGILQPKVKMALRTSGHLLLGIVRIYSRKAKYLLADCNEAFIKIKMAFRPGVVDLPEENREAAVATITLPEVFHDFDTGMPDINNIDMEAAVALNQSRAEDITLKEDYGSLSLMADDGFGDMAFDDPEMARDTTNIDEAFDHASLLLGDDQVKENQPETSTSAIQNISVPSVPPASVSLDAPLKDDGFGGAVGEGLLEGDTGNLFEPTGLFDDAPLGNVPLDSNVQDQDVHEPVQDTTSTLPQQPLPAAGEESDDDDDMYDMGPPSMGAPSGPSTPSSVAAPDNDLPDFDQHHQPPSVGVPLPVPPPSNDIMEAIPQHEQQMLPPDPVPADQTTLINNEEETFALAPLDTTVIQGAEKAKTKRKRKLIVDEVKNISGEEMKSQLSDTSDIVTTLDLAPPTKRLMHWKETGGVEKLFALPGRCILSRVLSRLYQRHLTTKAAENEDFGGEDDRMILEEESQPEPFRDEEQASVIQPAKRPRRGAAPPEMEEEMPPPATPLMDMGMPPPPQYPHQDYSHHLPQTPVPPPPPEYCQPPPEYMTPQHPDYGQHNLPTVGQDYIQSPTPAFPPQIPADMLPPVSAAEDTRQLFPLPGETHLQDLPSVHETQGQIPVPEEQHERSAFDDLLPPPTAAPPVQQDAEYDNQQPQAAESLLDHQQSESCLQQEQNQQEEQDREALPFADEQLENVRNEPLSECYPPDQQNHNPSYVDDDDDYGAPSSVGPLQPEEQLADETYEQFEERILNKRTVHMLHIIRHTLESGRQVRFTDVVRNNRRKQVAQKFYTFLVLKKQQAVELHQEGPYAELFISEGPKYSLAL